VDSSASMPVGRKVSGDWDEVVSATPFTPPSEATRTHYKVCNRCHLKKDVADFEGFKRCKPCREKVTRNWTRLMQTYTNAGVKQRIPLTDEEKERVLDAFARSCAFCGEHEETKVRITRLVGPRDGGGDEMWNIIPCCSSCIQSRKGWSDWTDWYKSQSELYSGFRYSRIVCWHNESELPKPPVKRSR
jgi:hypothetical protein